MFQAGLSAMLAVRSSAIPAFVGKDMYSNNKRLVDSSIASTLATAQVIFAAVYCHRQGRALLKLDPNQSFTYNLLLMMGFVDESRQRPNPKHALWVEKLLLVYADHEMSCATFAFVTAASAHSDPLSCYLAALTTLYGVIHGGAVDAAYLMLQHVSTLENVPSFMLAVKERKETLYGFGHRIYVVGDPRAQILLDILHEIQAETKVIDPLCAIAEDMDKFVSRDSFFQEKGVSINADLYMNLAWTAM